MGRINARNQVEKHLPGRPPRIFGTPPPDLEHPSDTVSGSDLKGRGAVSKKLMVIARGAREGRLS